MISMLRHTRSHTSHQAGFAIGPILFIIAILGILAAAIAAGSGSFTAGFSKEGNATKASALVQMGENLKIGMDRINMDVGTDVSNVIIGVTNTSNSVDLFSPTGGGIGIPSTSLASDPLNNAWWYPYAIIPSLGTNSPERLAVLQVTAGVCDQVNVKANALDPTVANYDDAAIGDPTNSANNLGNLIGAGKWPATLTARIVGCVHDTSTSTYWFYEVLAIQ